MAVVGVDHVQLAMPAGEEPKARRFYADLLGLSEVPKPAHLAVRGGAWFESPFVKIHLGIDPAFRPARKSHPGLLVTNLIDLIAALRTAGHEVVEGEPLDGYTHAYVDDPFGNRIELLEKGG
jgi:catechol 2,3-dioxygenase-like lactoylglutathione lyase family enzyme